MAKTAEEENKQAKRRKEGDDREKEIIKFVESLKSSGDLNDNL